jgi:hypothetical protein
VRPKPAQVPGTQFGTVSSLPSVAVVAVRGSSIQLPLVQKFVDLLQQLLQHWALAVHGELGPWLGKHAGVVVVPVGALVVVVTAVQLVAMTQLSVSPSGSGQQT